MSDEAEKVKKRCEIALAVATIASMDVELEAARAKVRTIKRHLVINSLMLNAAVLSGRRATRQVWAYPRCARWFEETLPNLGGQNFRQSFRVSKTTFKYLVDVCRPVMQRQTTNMRETALSWVSDLSLDSKHPKKRCSSLKKGHVVAAEPVPCSRSSFLQ
ncbi:hypothetical protein HPB49_008072 [Dermacentor silvarum]|uniref:Uncharacterized protein n=1 Tax=Dermacentor silvarum TaxID=543639 RepID=A0ACB8CQP8_DERSI|nr:hypothetical protein HPB49_008072 [Dermacentor silvarum]